MLVVRVESATQSASLDACGARSCAVVEGGRQVDDMTMVVVWVGDRRIIHASVPLYIYHTHPTHPTHRSILMDRYDSTSTTALVCSPSSAPIFLAVPLPCAM